MKVTIELNGKELRALSERLAAINLVRCSNGKQGLSAYAFVRRCVRRELGTDERLLTE